jgi:formylglycine-generating enzyme
MAGNVGQWKSDWYCPDCQELAAARGVARNPQGPNTPYDAADPTVKRKFTAADRFCVPTSIASAT